MKIKVELECYDCEHIMYFFKCNICELNYKKIADADNICMDFTLNCDKEEFEKKLHEKIEVYLEDFYE
jgi:hypothetical protein